ncbi:fatty acid elongase [Rhizoctonia solani AG-3 Rhs1AP]|uniref:Elongation of fatty acids protein n=1 Tax=Rhizoctonia solani AG-3 Rhs1AP TaxID=1086054 RepID=X8JV38_9AGAM|nr:fatty acid elongase [Rhizoctonia solani AG-3 Rhs1AP]
MAPLADALLSVIPKEWHLPSHLVTYQAGVTPLSTPPIVVACLVGYLTTIFSLREVMRSREPMKLNTLFQFHNLYLTTGSGLLLLLMVEEVFPIWWKNGLFNAMCAESSWTPRLEFYYMINYYIKYIELADTVFLVLKKKPLAFLHVFHHAATALLCFTQLNGRTSVSWVPIILNLTVHVFMYYYYWATAGGRRIWWKKYLTTMQITQFVIDLFAVYFASYSYFGTTYWPMIPTMGTCSGTEGAALFGCALLTSYLFLFIDFYIRTYKAPVKGKAKAS